MANLLKLGTATGNAEEVTIATSAGSVDAGKIPELGASGKLSETFLPGSSGIATVNFGAFPGNYDAMLAVSGQSAITSVSQVSAWIMAVATADHSADEHFAEPLRIIAGYITPSSGFIIRVESINGPSYGLFTVGWAWK